eukprot:7323865-Karenia_brevis.AAC.1
MTCTLMKNCGNESNCVQASITFAGLSTVFDAEVLRSSDPWCNPPVTGAFRMHQGGPEARLR